MRIQPILPSIRKLKAGLLLLVFVFSIIAPTAALCREVEWGNCQPPQSGDPIGGNKDPEGIVIRGDDAYGAPKSAVADPAGDDRYPQLELSLLARIVVFVSHLLPVNQQVPVVSEVCEDVSDR